MCAKHIRKHAGNEHLGYVNLYSGLIEPNVHKIHKDSKPRSLANVPFGFMGGRHIKDEQIRVCYSSDEDTDSSDDERSSQKEVIPINRTSLKPC